MRLCELQRPDSRHDAYELLRRAGYKRLGSGLFGAVFQAPGKPYVLKVFSAKDWAFMEFAKMVMGDGNPHFPKFYKKVVKVTDQYYAVRTEPLQPYQNSTLALEYITMYMGKKLPKDYMYGGYYYAAKRHERDLGTNETAFMDAHPDLRDACDRILALVETEAVILDLKDDNLMMRRGTVVFTDPVVGSGP